MKRIRVRLGLWAYKACLRLLGLTQAGLAAMILAAHMPPCAGERAKAFHVMARDEHGEALYCFTIMDVPVAVAEPEMPADFEKIEKRISGAKS